MYQMAEGLPCHGYATDASTPQLVTLSVCVTGASIATEHTWRSIKSLPTCLYAIDPFTSSPTKETLRLPAGVHPCQ